MSYLVTLVLDDRDQCDSILEAWEQAGAGGITILESSGLGRLKRSGIRDDLPLMPSLSDLLKSNEIHHRTLFSVVETEALADRLVEATQEQLGDLEEPDNGFLFVIEVHKAFGLSRAKTSDSAGE